jgi:hypothetical protein
LNRKEKLASALTGAIAAYLQQEEEAKAQAFERSSLTRPKSPWGLSARQDTMQLRRLYQLRITRR